MADWMRVAAMGSLRSSMKCNSAGGIRDSASSCRVMAEGFFFFCWRWLSGTCIFEMEFPEVRD
jgi:hypothetical protein